MHTKAALPTHIGLNAHLLSLDNSYRGAGINSYIFQILRNLEKTGSDNRYWVFLNEQRYTSDRLKLCYSRWPTSNPMVRILWEQLIQPFALRQARIDLLHAMAFVGPLATRCPMVITIYDLSFLRYPEAFRPFNRWYLSRFTTISARRAQRIITISESTKQDVIKMLKVPEDRVDVIYCGVDDAFQPLPQNEVDRFRTRYGLPDRFVLFLGTLEPRKNVETLIGAYARWRDAKPDAPTLVVAGAKGWYYQQVFARVENLGLKDKVFFPGYVPPEDLPLLYNAADLFVYPSRFEGFGLPVLESMACGTPVICSNVSSLPEVAGDAALLINPDDEHQLAVTMQDVWEDSALSHEMSRKGRSQALRFSWEQAALQTEASYRHALGS